jgi:hypothetical protein
MTAPERKPVLRDSKSNLYEAALAAVKAQEEVAASRPRPKQKTRLPLLTIMLLLALTAAFLLLLRPVWLVGPEAPPAQSPAVAAASFRLTLLRERDRVYDYSRRNGHLPATLAEAGGESPNISLRSTGPDQFVLSGIVGDSLITLRSTDTMSVFLGNTLRAIRNRGRQ